MPRLRWSEHSLKDIGRLYNFLAPNSLDVASRAIRKIREGVKQLGKHPEIGRPIEGLSTEFREWTVEFGASAYVVLYRYDSKEVVLLAVRHGREAGY